MLISNIFNTDTLTLAGFCLVIVGLLAVIIRILWNRSNDRDDFDGLF